MAHSLRLKGIAEGVETTEQLKFLRWNSCDQVQGFLYVNVRGGLGLARRLAGARIPGSVERNLGPLKSALMYAATRPSEVQLTFFVRIG